MKQHAEVSLFVKHIVDKQQFQDLYFAFKIEKTGLLIFNSLKQKTLILNFFVNRNWKKITDSRKRAKILPDNRKSHHPIETLYFLLCELNLERNQLRNREKGPTMSSQTYSAKHWKSWPQFKVMPRTVIL